MKVTYIEAPTEYKKTSNSEMSLFLAGGISGCPDWQLKFMKLVSEERETVTGKNNDIVFLNPRRDNFPIGDPSASEAQIKWENFHLKSSDYISFWFCKETLCPIVLYELGTWIKTDKKIFIGVEDGYIRKADVEIQSKLERPNIEIKSSLQDLAKYVASKINRGNICDFCKDVFGDLDIPYGYKGKIYHAGCYSEKFSGFQSRNDCMK
jgi:hypothetical protein